MKKKKVNKIGYCVPEEAQNINSFCITGTNAYEDAIKHMKKESKKIGDAVDKAVKFNSKHIGSDLDDVMEEFDSAEDDVSGVMELKHKKYPWYTELYYAFYRNIYDPFLSPFNLYYWLKRKYRQIFILGFDPKDCWSLDYSCSKWLLPRLNYLKDRKTGTPCISEQRKGESDNDYWNRQEEEWDKIMWEIILTHELIVEEGELNLEFQTNRTLRKIRQMQIDKGLALFAKYYQNLWD
jgi:hypothetical protein